MPRSYPEGERGVKKEREWLLCPKGLESPDMAIDPGGPIRAEGKADKAMVTVGKSHDKGPGPTRFTRNRIEHRFYSTKIDLHLASWFYLQSNRHVTGGVPHWHCERK